MKRPDILLVNPWIHDFAAYDLWARPMGLLLLASRLRRSGWEPHFLDCVDPDHPEMPRTKVHRFSDGRFAKTRIEKPAALQGFQRVYSRYGVAPEIIRKDLKAVPRPRAILITSLMTYWYPGVRETLELIREVFPDVPVLLGGIYASLLPEHARKICQVDEVIVGPGEAGLFRSLQQQTGIGLLRQSEESSLEFSPALHLMRRVRFLPMLTSRGCPFHCSYCASGRIMAGFVQRKPAEVIAEIESAVAHYGISDIALYDDAFLVNATEHALPILEAAADRFPGMRWHSPNGLHAAAITLRVAREMKRAGFETIRLGLESSSDGFHARTGAKTNVGAFTCAVRNLTDAGFSRAQIGVYLLVGIPGQTREQIEQDVEFVLQNGALPKLAEYSPIPGTAMWAESLEAAKYPIHAEPLFQNCISAPHSKRGCRQPIPGRPPETDFGVERGFSRLNQPFASGGGSPVATSLVPSVDR